MAEAGQSESSTLFCFSHVRAEDVDKVERLLLRVDRENLERDDSPGAG